MMSYALGSRVSMKQSLVKSGKTSDDEREEEDDDSDEDSETKSYRLLK
jgi:hypothetical protein